MTKEKETTFETSLGPTARIGRFQVIRELGRGSSGAVYLARDPVIDRDVAIKTFRPNANPASRKASQQHFVNEARAAGRLSHPFIVTIFEAMNAGDTTYIAMEHLQGKELHRILQTGRRFDFKETSLIVKRLAQALEYAHQNGVVHRDIKPANIFMLKDNYPKLVDFGIARAPNRLADDASPGDDPYTLFNNNVMGTPNYMSPEQAMGKPADWRTDIYSLGVVMYELLSGRRPFDYHDTHELLQQVAYKAPRAPHEIDPNVPVRLSKIAMKAMGKRPEQRYQQASDIVDDIKRYLVVTSREQRDLQRIVRQQVPTQAQDKSPSIWSTRLVLLICLVIASAFALWVQE